MAKLFSIHQIEVHRGVQAEEFERVFNEELLAPHAAVPGWKVSHLEETAASAP